MTDPGYIRQQPTFSERDEIIERVRRGKMTPQDADKWANQKGQPPFTGPRKSFDPMDDVFWTLPMTAAWIIWRKTDMVQNICRGRIESRKWIFHNWRMLNQQTGLIEEVLGFESESENDFAISDVWDLSLRSDHLERAMNEVNAREDLRRKLQAGQLVATGLAEEGKRRQIEAYEWQDLSLDSNDSPADAIYPLSGRAPAFRKVSVPKEAVQNLWPQAQAVCSKDSEAETAPPPTVPAVHPMKRRGRPPAPGLDQVRYLFEIKISKLGLPDLDNEPGWRTQADLERFISEELEARGTERGENAVRRIASQWIEEESKKARK